MTSPDSLKGLAERLRELAEKATPGPRAKMHLDYGYEELAWVRPDGTEVEWNDADFDLAAACDPQTILALLAENARLRDEVEAGSRLCETILLAFEVEERRLRLRRTRMGSTGRN